MGKPLSGMYAALLTGFSDDGAFDPSRQTSITNYVLNQGLDGIYIGGSSGESGLMSTDELLEQQLVIAGMPEAKQARIIAHVGQPSQRDSIALARQAEKLEFDALSALPPHSYPFSDEEVYRYYAELAASTNLPLIVYEVPIRTGRPLPVELLTRILDIPNVVGLKFTSPDLFKLSVLRRRQPDKTFYFGFDEIFAGAAILGCDGGIGTTYNVLGRLYSQIHKSIGDSDVEVAQRLQNVSQQYVELLAEIGVVPGVKATLRALGVDAGFCRAPMIEKVDDAEGRLTSFLANPEVSPWLLQ